MKPFFLFLSQKKPRKTEPRILIALLLSSLLFFHTGSPQGRKRHIAAFIFTQNAEEKSLEFEEDEGRGDFFFLGKEALDVKKRKAA